MAGDGSKGGSGESAELPTEVKEVLTLLVKSNTRRKAVLQTTFERQGDQIHSFGKIHSRGIGNWPPRLNQQSPLDNETLL
jgi:hypothetical protein